LFGREIELHHYYIDFIFGYGVVCCLEVYEKMMSSGIEFVVFFPGSVAVLTAGMWLICLTGTLLGNAVVPRLLRVIGGYALLWR
jgi:hypothetical protein